MKVFFMLVTLAAVTVGCTSFKTAEDQPTEVAVSSLSVGDTVQIVTADGDKVRFRIEAIEDDALIGQDVRILLDEIRLVSVEHIDVGKTAAAGGITFGIIASIGLLILVATFAG